MIPKNLFFIWFGDNKPNYVDFVVKTFKEINPDFNVQLIEYSKELFDTICSFPSGKLDKIYKYDHDYLLNWSYHYLLENKKETIDKCGLYGAMSDCYRYTILDYFGGIYLDCDMFPIKPFDNTLLSLNSFRMSRMINRNYIEIESGFLGRSKNDTYNNDNNVKTLYPILEVINKTKDLEQKFINCKLKYGEYYGDPRFNYVDHYSQNSWRNT